ncbi:unnamed protein product [Rangifer tarandus platyrhynchus]|uniref:Uncharacterized protein n=2 Tax=Rangifer tarandus platyrhynchus TaxID=3082113 RepID=A0ACB0F4C6_RANTA|nr:unnamed protein product [Rangifer tarandus platyrhynchus]CAI9707159.1 unnamed protein product [Rangifer tarandus platyrhynchus]
MTPKQGAPPKRAGQARGSRTSPSAGRARRAEGLTDAPTGSPARGHGQLPHRAPSRPSGGDPGPTDDPPPAPPSGTRVQRRTARPQDRLTARPWGLLPETEGSARNLGAAAAAAPEASPDGFSQRTEADSELSAAAGKRPRASSGRKSRGAGPTGAGAGASGGAWSGGRGLWAFLEHLTHLAPLRT